MGPRFPPLLTLFIYFFCLCPIRFSLLLFLLYALILISPSLVPLAGHLQTPHQAAGQPFKFTIPESLDRIKEEFQFLQAQYHSLKLECEKLASEKTEMQRHYVMVGIKARRAFFLYVCVCPCYKCKLTTCLVFLFTVL